MKTYISLLRGINISGHRTVKMDLLKALYVEMGFVNAQTYIQSGNVVFQHHTENTTELEKMIAEGIRLKFGFDVPVIVVDTEDLSQIIASNPFLDDQTRDISKIYLTFLSGLPDREKYDQIGKGHTFEEDYLLFGKTIFIYCPNGYGNTKLSTNFLESKLKLTATSRNWKTTLELQSMARVLSTISK